MAGDHHTKLSRREALALLAAGPGLLLLRSGPLRAAGASGPADADPDWSSRNWGYAIDPAKCIGCGACVRACRAENHVPVGRFRTWVERYHVLRSGEVHVDVAPGPNHVFTADVGVPREEIVKAFFVPKLCNHCERSVCSQVCPVGATYTSPDGVVLVDSKHCIGCGYCVQACPYGTRFINPETHVADKCTLCYHRIRHGLQPACVQACPTGARLFGDLNDPHGMLTTVLSQRRYRVLKPEMGTHPKCFYLGLDREVV